MATADREAGTHVPAGPFGVEAAVGVGQVAPSPPPPPPY